MTAPGDASIRAIVRKEMAVSAVINAVLSIGFFLLVFGWPKQLMFGAPDHLALDFLPQFAAVTLMSALVPAFVTRRKLAAASGGVLATGWEIVLRAAGLCLCSLVLAGIAITAVQLGGWSEIGGTSALAMKTVVGAALGAVAARVALGRLIGRGLRAEHRETTTTNARPSPPLGERM